MEASREMITAWSYGIAGCIYSAFAIYLIADWHIGLRSRALLLAVLMCALWGMAGLAYALTGHALFLSGSLFFDLLRYSGWHLFLLALLKPDFATDDDWPVRLRWLAAMALLLFVAGCIAQAMVALGTGFIFPPQRLVLLDSLAMSVLALLLLEQLFRNVPHDLRWSIKPLCIGLGGAVLFDLYLFSDAVLFNRIDADAFSIRGFVHALVVPLVAISTIRNRGWKKRIVLSRHAAVQSVTLLAVGIYLLLIASVAYYVRYFGGDWGRAFQLAILFAALLLLGILSLSGSIRAKFRVLVGKHFFNYRYDYREEWLRFTHALSSQDGFSQMGQHVIKGLANMVESPAGALWLRDPSARFYAQAACWNLPVSVKTEDVDSPLSRFLVSSGWVINIAEYHSRPQHYHNLDLPEWLHETPNAWLVIPLTTSGEMIGFVVLATARTHIDVDWEVNDLLKTAGQQAGAFLGQMQASEALMEARKFDAFNRMSAFVVHDLKNIIAQLSLMLKNAERHRDNAEFQQDMLNTVEHSVERMRQLMMQLREGATPIDGPRGVDLGDLVRRIQIAKQRQGVSLEINQAEKILVKGHQDRIERVIGHIVQNALDATEENGRVWLEMSRIDGHAMVKICDTGHGMSAEFLRERLFKPFQTTKPAGMGIGAYESFQYVNELGGKISVTSEIDVGTQVAVFLPIFEADSASMPISHEEVQ